MWKPRIHILPAITRTKLKARDKSGKKPWTEVQNIEYISETTVSILCPYFFVTLVQIQCPFLYTLFVNCNSFPIHLLISYFWLFTLNSR